MSTTENYGLPLFESDQTLFTDWRKSINCGTGDGSTAFEKIDKALKDKIKFSLANLSAESWSELDTKQDITVDLLTPEDEVFIALADTADTSAVDAACKAKMSVKVEEAGKISVTCNGKKPEVDIPVIVGIIN